MRIVSTILGSVACAACLVCPDPSLAQPAPGQIGVYLDAGGLTTSTCTSFGQTIDVYVVANVNDDIAAAEFRLAPDTRLIEVAENLPAGWLRLDVGTGLMIAGSPCLAGSGLVTLAHYQFLTAETGPTIPPFTVSLEIPTYSSFDIASSGYTSCDDPISEASLHALSMANDRIDLAYDGQCQVPCGVTWEGPNNGSFTDPMNWSAGTFPFAQLAVVRRSSSGQNICNLQSGSSVNLCGLRLEGSPGNQVLQIFNGATLSTSSGIDVYPGGELAMVGGSVAGLIRTVPGGTMFGSGGGTIEDLDNAGTLSFDGGDLEVTGLLDNSGNLVFQGGATLELSGQPLANRGTFASSYTFNEILGDVHNMTDAQFLVNSATVDVSGCIQNDTGGLVWVKPSATLLLGCANATGAGEYRIEGTCAACKVDGSKVPEDTVLDFAGGFHLAPTAGLTLSDAVLRLSGSLLVEIDDPERLDLRYGVILFRETPDFCTIEAMSSYRGRAHPLDEQDIEVIGALRLADSESKVRLVDQHSNSSQGEEEVVYVESLDMAAGSTLDLGGLTLLYAESSPVDPGSVGSGVTITDSVGGGSLVHMSEGTGVDQSRPPTVSLELLPAEPNPFNPRTTIRWRQAERGRVELRIFDERGTGVREIPIGVRGPGEHFAIWGGLDDRGIGVASGVYFVRISVGRIERTGKLALVR